MNTEQLRPLAHDRAVLRLGRLRESVMALSGNTREGLEILEAFEFWLNELQTSRASSKTSE